MFVPTKFLPNPHDPFQEPALRWQRCLYLHRHGRRPSFTNDDDATHRGWQYLLDRNSCRDRSSRNRVTQRHSAVAVGHHLFKRAELLERAEVEARLLAGQADEDIAARCGLAPAAVRVYHDLFFCVRDALDAQAYIFNVVIGPKARSGLSANSKDILLKLLGYAHGPPMVDATLRYFRNPPALPPRLDGLDASALAELHLLLQVHALILTLVEPAQARDQGKLLDNPASTIAGTASHPASTVDGIKPLVTEEPTNLSAAFLSERMLALTPAGPPAVLPFERQVVEDAPDWLDQGLAVRCG